MHEWINLTNYLGDNFSNPTDSQLKNTLSKLFDTKDNEHPNAWIECGTEKGPLYSLDIYSGGYAIYTVFNNVDMEEELENKKIDNINTESGFNLWNKLINGKIDEI
jgi:hypothetical protein